MVIRVKNMAKYRRGKRTKGKTLLLPAIKDARGKRMQSRNDHIFAGFGGRQEGDIAEEKETALMIRHMKDAGALERKFLPAAL